MPTPQLIVPHRFGDARGWFSESYSRRTLAELCIFDDFVQDNHSLSASRGTLRGLHFQAPPHAQAKLVRCIAGAIWDVAVDIRAESPTYGMWVGAELTAAGGEQLYVPVGFAHGFVTLTDDAEVAYKTSDYYAPECDGGIIWNDQEIAVEWPITDLDPILSDKDQQLQQLKDFASPFQYDGIPLSPLV
jgi:dTDP-4-dehydrorhamnose 3,5-epimerase